MQPDIVIAPVVGFDDVAGSLYRVPPLTTVRQPLYEELAAHTIDTTGKPCARKVLIWSLR